MSRASFTKDTKTTLGAKKRKTNELDISSIYRIVISNPPIKDS